MNILASWLTMPFSNRTKRVDVVETWEVRWMSRKGDYHADVRPEVVVFTSHEAAHEFAVSLKNAFSLLRHTAGAGVSVSRIS